MITNDDELQATQERIAFFYKTLANMRLKATPEEYRLYSNSYLIEIDKMHSEVIGYLKKHPSETPAEAA
jgi:hypothetical protein